MPINDAIIAITNIPKIYLRHPVVGNRFKSDERVTTYEYYHQLRNQINNLEFQITGELIKRARLLPGFNQTQIPDILIHSFGIVENNQVVIEVKTNPKTTAKQILADLDKLNYFMSAPMNYIWGILFITNCDFSSKINRSKAYQQQIWQLLGLHRRILVLNILPYENRNDDIVETPTEADIKVINWQTLHLNDGALSLEDYRIRVEVIFP